MWLCVAVLTTSLVRVHRVARLSTVFNASGDRSETERGSVEPNSANPPSLRPPSSFLIAATFFSRFPFFALQLTLIAAPNSELVGVEKTSFRFGATRTFSRPSGVRGVRVPASAAPLASSLFL